MTKREHHENIAKWLRLKANQIIHVMQYDLKSSNENLYEWDADNKDILTELNEVLTHINHAVNILETENRRERLSKAH